MCNDSWFCWLFLLVIMLLLAGVLSGCSQQLARHGFGKLQTELECNRKLININWKGENNELWYLTRPFRHDDIPETYRFKASTTFGILEGEVIILEKKCS